MIILLPQALSDVACLCAGCQLLPHSVGWVEPAEWLGWMVGTVPAEMVLLLLDWNQCRPCGGERIRDCFFLHRNNAFCPRPAAVRLGWMGSAGLISLSSPAGPSHLNGAYFYYPYSQRTWMSLGRDTGRHLDNRLFVLPQSA